MTLAEHRRALHQIPETGWDVAKTAGYIKNVLQGFPCEVFSPVEGSVCAFFDFRRGQTVAFRADMDALPITEQTGLPFASKHEGKMHACGHDGHMAILLGLAEYVSRQKELERNVLLIFQPAEETTGGAEALCATGLLKNRQVDSIYGLHLWPALPKDVVGSREDGLMSRSCEFTVEIRGKTAHIAQWQRGRDALSAAAELISRLYEMAEDEPCVLRFGKMESGTVRNAVSDHTLLEGSLRAFDEELYEELKEQIAGISQEVSDETGCQIGLSYSAGYPPIQNDKALLQRAKNRFPMVNVKPSFTTEDFSCYQRRVPGVFFWLGTGGAPLHSPRFDFDESVLETGLALFQALL